MSKANWNLVWFNINAAWAALAENARAIRADHDKKRDNEWKIVGDYTRKDSDLIGLAAEWVYARHTGREWKYKWNPGGDGGHDFPGIDVKGRASGTSPNMYVRVDAFKRHKGVHTYTCVEIDEQWRHGAIIGRIDKTAVARHPKSRVQPNWPKNYVIPLSHLDPPPPTSTRYKPCEKPNDKPCVFTWLPALRGRRQAR